MTDLSDDQLLDAWCAGESAAGHALLSRHFAALFRFFQNKVGAEADDLVQRTLLACTESRARMRRESSFRTFLFAIARHQLYHHFRRTRSDADRLDFGVSTLSDLRSSATARLARAEQQAALELALAQLPLDDQILLELAYTEELDSPALGEIFELEPATVRARLFRARRQLERLLASG